MAIKYIASTTNSILVGDVGTNGATPKPTKVGTENCSAVLELQSTTRGFLPPRMTDAQIVAIPNLVPGTQAFNTETEAMAIYTTSGGWVDQTGPTGTQYMSGVLTAAQINDMYNTGISLIPAPGANKSIIVTGFLLELNTDGTPFTGGGAIGLQYGTAGHAGLAVSATIAATLLTGAGVDRLSYALGGIVNAVTANYVNTAVAITNATAVFAAGGFSAVNWKIWYSIVPTA